LGLARGEIPKFFSRRVIKGKRVWKRLWVANSRQGREESQDSSGRRGKEGPGSVTEPPARWVGVTLLEYNVPVIGSNSTSPSSNVNRPTYVCDNKFIFRALDIMMHYIHLLEMEDSSSIYTWKEKCEMHHFINM
jgi:hypothetical protein